MQGVAGLQAHYTALWTCEKLSTQRYLQYIYTHTYLKQTGLYYTAILSHTLIDMLKKM